MILRFMKLQKVFEENRGYVFKAYEDDGGEYMGVEDEEEDDDPTPVKTNDDNFEEDFE